ncbi:MAG: hypothetical protein P1V18_02090 [Candidatus Gracilibacteria bacterium]|nr:hypothetical protein [Candidatus Gracilibacteria bacterium]
METSQTHQSDTTEYSGQAQHGLDREASYDRMQYLDHNQILSLQEVGEVVDGLLTTFEESDRSRLVVRLLVESNYRSGDLITLSQLDPHLECDLYPDQENRFQYLTVSLNNSARSLHQEIYSGLSDMVQSRIIELTSMGRDFESQGIQLLESARQRGLSLAHEINAVELTALWEPFGWSRDAVENILRGNSRDIIMGIRNGEGELMGAAFYSDQSHGSVRHGETTEWAISPNDRQRGVVQPLILAFHAYLLENGIQNIWADLRTPDPTLRLPNSLRPGAYSGMSFYHNDHHRFVSSNHVTIEGTPQSYNTGSEQVFGETPQNLLRSFVRGWVNHHLFTPRLRDACADFML